ncbi:MAG: iron-sulfur cluster-binding protein [Chloroflexaceae bacterium]|nr:iron-sulfur cluster-binding protein [Chloroflexaceae bacterium]
MATQMLPFYDRVEDALQNSTLQHALERNMPRFVALRAQALDKLIDEAALRDQARAIRAKSLARLDELLTRLADTVEARGGHVCWATDGKAAGQYIAELAQRQAVKSIVKSKSMASEEIHLNAQLEAHSLEVIETDLGEYIIQLSGETPSHIIAPAIHMTRQEIGQLFQEKLGMEPTEDIPTMTRTARRVLRQRFVQADMGISGVNFGIAESGGMVLVTNEGNADLTTSVPRIHVAIMGIERVVESLDDLAVMLQVLARSATGQKLSVYTTFLSGPTRPGEPDGPEEFHLILLDNGRSRILGSAYAEALMCIRCGACLNACPVYQSIGGHAYGGVYSGPIGSVISPLLHPDLPDVHQLPYASTLCGACQEACPVRIALPDMLLRLRGDAVQAGKVAPGEQAAMTAWQATMNNPALYRAGGTMASIITRLVGGREGVLKQLPPPLAGWTQYRDFPTFAKQSFSERWATQHGTDEEPQ